MFGTNLEPRHWEAARRWCGLVLVGTLLGLARPAAAQPAGTQHVPAKIQAALVLKLLGYDRKLATRSPGGVMLVAVIGTDETGTKFKALQGREIQGKKLQVKLLSTNGTNPVKETLTSLGANVIYLGPKSDAAKATETIAWANANKVPVFGGTHRLAEQGAAIGFMVAKGKPRFTINVAASRKQGIELPNRVLRLAELIK